MKKVPKLKNEKLEDAKKILEEAKIAYEEKEEKEFSLSVRRGRVTRTEPKENEELKKEEKVTIYVSKICLLPFILMFLIILILGIMLSALAIYSNNRPEIAKEYEGWVPKNVVYVSKDVDKKEIAYYEYCVTSEKSSKKCDWKKTKTKNTELSETGVWNVYFKARYVDGEYSYVSKRLEVLIDNDAPVIEKIEKEVTSNSLRFNVIASDLGSGIKSYSYKLGNEEYKSTKKDFTIKGLKANTEYQITLRVEDNAGNVYEVTFKEKTKEKEENNTTTPGENPSNPEDKTTDKTENTTNKPGENDPTKPTTPGEVTKPSDKTTEKTTEKTKPTESTSPTEPTKPVEPVVEIPKIDLNDLPSVFEYGDDYKLPSHVEFGPSGGTYSCAIDHDWSKNVESTKTLAVGKYTVSCKAVSKTGTYAEVSKDIKVSVPTGEDEEWDGWIRLNLYYPAGSINREWRIHREGEIRGEDEGWESYTGPILVKVSDIENVYIRYTLDGEEVIDIPTSKVLVDIQAEKLVLEGNETTKVKIIYDKAAKVKEYRINGGKWINYTEAFSVGADTLIEARAEREENVYDNDGNFVMTKTLAGSDALYIEEQIEESIDYGNVAITIKPEKESLSGNELTTVEIEYEDGSTTRMYKIDEGPWLEYTGPFTVGKNQTITATAEKSKNITLDNGIVRNGIARGRAIKTIKDSDNPQEENRLQVNISATPTRLLKNKKARVSLTSNEANAKIYYSLDNSNYVEYTANFEVGSNTRIYAKAEYEGKYAYDARYVGAVELSDILEGPTITQNPTSITEKTIISITTKESAKHIYYSFNGNAYSEYTGEFELTKNGIIRSYYIRSDNKKSETTYYYVQNIKQKNKPYVRIDAKPSIYLSEDVNMVAVTISGRDYDTLEYSYNGIEYYPYTTPLHITQSRSVYAKGTNKFGETIEKLNITTSIAPIPVEKLDVAITFDPEKENVEGLINKLSVTINYDSRATSKYYRLGNGPLQVYNGPFEVRENTTVYAYAISETGLGSTSKQINYLTTGIANPIIRVNPETPNTWVRVEIEYASTASVKKYKLDNGEWLDYIGPIELITNNTTVYAYNEDTLSNHEEASKLIDNIIPKDNIVVLDNGMYYLIRLNYPSDSIKENREYKWKKTGTWKKYDDKGILLIRPEYKDKVIGADGVKIKDSNGKEITLKDHYYVLDLPLSELTENLFMRWDFTKPSTPTFILSTESWTRELTVGINYAKTSAQKLYKIVYEDGEDTGWLNYEKPIKINQENTIIYAKSINEFDIESEIGSKRITNIDTRKPEILNVNVIKKGSSSFTLEVNAQDDTSAVEGYMYSLDNDEYVSTSAKSYTFNNLKNNTEYHIYIKVVDKAGNTSDISEVVVTTTEIGNITYSLDKEDWAVLKNLTINYPEDVYNGYSYEYSLDLGATWLPYENPLQITENNAVVIARVVDGENIKVATSFTVSKIDATEPTISLEGLPDIFSQDKEYNLPTSYTDGISGSNRSCKVNNRETEYTNSSDLPAGEYTITCTITTGAGLSASVSKGIKVTKATIKGESILNILESDKLKTGYYDFEVNDTGIVYPVHLYVLDGNQEWTENKVFGDAADVATASTNAQNMVIVKVNGDLTISSGVTVRPYYNSYGGPKGFTLFVTGTLTNNGTIDNSHGAKAVGENVYLWKNADGTYEYVPATGGAGGAAANSASYPVISVNGKNGSAGSTKAPRATGGGGSGASKCGGASGAGGAGTSYSGGAGGGARNGGTPTSGSSIGGAGGNAFSQRDGESASAGSGNPGGLCNGTRCYNPGNNGTGGLLILYANSLLNNGAISAKGTTTKSGYIAGGSSGGGSINIFYQTTITKGTANVSGGSVVGTGGKGGAGGAGTVSYTQVDLTPVVEVSNTESESFEVKAPTITINTTEYASKKTVTIKYPSGFTNEYSLDYGESWTPYETPITVSENVTVIARVRSGNETLSSSSFTITKIKKDEENNNQEIPDEFTLGDDYVLPENCKINDERHDNISELSEGEYNLVCELTNGENPLVNKTIKIKKNEEVEGE